jgi:hypothetical protein
MSDFGLDSCTRAAWSRGRATSPVSQSEWRTERQAYASVVARSRCMAWGPWALSANHDRHAASGTIPTTTTTVLASPSRGGRRPSRLAMMPASVETRERGDQFITSSPATPLAVKLNTYPIKGTQASEWVRVCVCIPCQAQRFATRSWSPENVAAC